MKHRRLTWFYALGTATLRGNFASKPIDMTMLPTQGRRLPALQLRCGSPAPGGFFNLSCSWLFYLIKECGPCVQE